MSDLLSFTRPLVMDVLRNWERYEWTLQGFGMLRTYISKEVRLHVWNSKFMVPNVTTIHDHPWHFESLVIIGSIVNLRYDVVGAPFRHPLWASDYVGHDDEVRAPFIKSKIVCGAGGNNDAAALLERGERVWLSPQDSMTCLPGESYQQRADEIHHTSYVDGTVTLVRREFLPNTEHAHVFFKESYGWVSAEPRAATADEVTAFVERAMLEIEHPL